MSKIHVLTSDVHGNYKMAVHQNVPPGNNSAGKSWSSCVVDSGRNITILPTLQADDVTEYDSVIAGSIFEYVFILHVDPNDTNAASIEALIDILLAEANRRLQQTYKYYGYTIGVV